jgi:hypothetical protein
MSRSSAQVRAELAAVLPLDLVGPWPGSPLESESLSQPPSRWYLTGFLVPRGASEDQAIDPTSTEEIAAGEGAGPGDDETPTERATARRPRFPSSIGISVLVPAGERFLDVTVSWGDYRLEEHLAEPGAEPARAPREIWQRTPGFKKLSVDLDGPRQIEISGSDGLHLSVRTRPIRSKGFDLVPPGTRAVAIFLVNGRKPAEENRRKDERFAFQAALRVELPAGFVPRPNLRGLSSKEWDEQVADLQYRNAWEFAVGHGIATHAVEKNGTCRVVETTWIPTAQVEKVVPGGVPESVELRMETLAAFDTQAALADKLRPLVQEYGQWLDGQKEEAKGIDHPNRRAVADELLRRAGLVRDRIEAGIELLAEDAQAFEAFRIANRVMAKAARRRAGDFEETKDAPRWRPFQLAFLLMNLRGIVEPAGTDRETVDLLFFPTGGGKTEAYLGLAAFTLVLRRLKHPGIASAGVTVLMRYTLRLLTLDQLGRAAALICALELERQKDPKRLGEWPFEIGLWVGQAATPNRMGKKGDGDRYSARARTIAFQNDDHKPSPIPLENCPWCNTKFNSKSFVLVANGKPNEANPTDLRITCANRGCVFRNNQLLPIVAVDDAIYRRLPCFLIATVDKFASLPFVGRTGALFGKVDRADKEGFYGPADPGRGRRLDSPLLPPDLVIQDELHLISGPLGTMVGLYETVLDALATRTENSRQIRPKVVASTATVRRADRQIQALFARSEVEIFPPPGPDVRDSFFARTVEAADPDNPVPGTQNARLYIGIAAQGRSLKVVLLRTYLALMAAAQKLYQSEGGAKNAENPADPYLTLLGYFNSLRELGGSRRIVEDEVRSRLAGYRRRARLDEREGPFADRTIAYDVLELTSRETTSKVADAKRRLALPFHEDDHVDVAIATNMISVGLDITRLGLMVVLGQPKTTAEYIQATSRVGRDEERPGLVVTLLNVHRPRDRSHYERFEAFHASFYRAVEATSVTPFAPRAVDRGLPAIAVALARHGLGELTPASAAINVGKVRTRLGFVGETIGERYSAHDMDIDADIGRDKRIKLEGRTGDLLDEWVKLARAQDSAGLQYHDEDGGPPPLLRDPLDPELASMAKADPRRRFKAQRSLRDVEPSVNLWARTLDDSEIDDDEEAAE